MGTRNQQGFTIIEVSLFLGISGLLVFALLGGWTTMIDTQRYKDSVKTLQVFIQQQYNLVYNVENGRGDELSCIPGGATTSPNIDDTGIGSERGQSDCILMGRYIHVDSGSKIVVYSIAGNDLLTDDSTSDQDSIDGRNPVRVEQELGLTDNSLTIPWQAAVVNEGGDPRSLAIAIIRSPLTGTVHTYTVPVSGGALPDVKVMVANATAENEVNLCLDPESNFSGGRMGVVIKQRASAQSFIQTISDGAGVC